MVDDPMTTELPDSGRDVSMAERFSSFADYATWTQTTPRPAAASLDVARFHAFTGEISLSSDPGVRLYLDGGSVYHAGRLDDPSITEQLRAAGVVDADQIERGIVRVGDVEHLGRLFEREASIDRDAVMVVLETRTEEIVSELANRALASVTVSAYRHHPSGIHRWFVARPDEVVSQAPTSIVAPADRPVADDLPQVGVSPLTLRWTESDSVDGGSGLPVSNPWSVSDDRTGDLAIQAELDRFDADQADWHATGRDEPSGITPLDVFQVLWPDGSRDVSIDAGRVAGDAIAPAASLPAVPVSALSAIVPEPTPELAPTAMHVESLPEPDSAVPDDVASAVKRALAAIEQATTGRAAVTELSLAPIALSELRLAPTPSLRSTAPEVTAAPSAEAIATAVVPAPAAPLGFAPPTPDMAAEAIYARAAAAAAVEAGAASGPVPATSVEQSSGEPGSATPGIQEPAQGRRSALRRLIGSLRGRDD